MSATYFRTGLRDDGETEIEVEIGVVAWGSAAVTSGPPEACDPGEPVEGEIVDAWLLSDADKADAPRITLTPAEEERILADFYENPPEDDYDPDHD